MRFLATIFGLTLLAIGTLLALFAIVGYTQGERGVAIFLGCVALLLILIGGRWYKGKGKSGSWKKDSATDRQKEFADDLGIKYPADITKGELSTLISEKTGR